MTANSGAQTTGRVLAGRYRLGSRRGAGLDIAIFEALDAQLDRQVAVRLVHPDICAAPGFPERFRDTMHKVASLTHPNLATVLDWGPGEWNGQPVQFVVTENLAGGSLRDLLDRGRLLSPSQALVIGLDVCRALDAAHRDGLVHGDVRPANVLFGTDRLLRVVDLGLAELAGATLWADRSSVSMERARYASPERAAGLPLEPKSDVYSLALMLIELVNGHVPFAGDSTVATLTNRLDRLMPVTADLGPLAAVLERAGRPHPDTRFTAAEFGRAMVQTAEKLPRPGPLPLLAGATGDGSRDSTGPVRLGAIPSDITAPLAPPDLTTWKASPAAPGDATPAGSPLPDALGAAAVAAIATPKFGPTPVVAAPATEMIPKAEAQPDDAATVVMPAVSGPPTAVMPLQGRAVAPSTASVVSSVPLAAGAVPPPPPTDEPPLLRERRSRRKLFALLAVIILAAGIGGAIAWYVNRDQSNAVPELVGLDAGAALNEISEFGWETSQTMEASDTVDEGVVLRTDPAAGVRLDRGDDFLLVVSGGPAPRVLPEIVGMTIPGATATLEALGLVLQEGDRVNDEVLAPGTIVSWVVPDQPGLVAGGTALPATVIVVTTSAGPAARDVPDLTGLSLADATAQLEALGLLVVQLPDEFSPDVPIGAVTRQNPTVGSKVAKGSTIEVALSKGPDLVVVPALAALTVDQATAAVEAAGLAIGQVKGDPAGLATRAEFEGQPLTAESALPRGTPVDVTFEVPPPPPTTTTVPPTTTTVPPTTTTPPTTAPTG